MIIMKINIGDYVRTKEGIIDQVIIEYNGYCSSPSCNCKHVSCRRNYYDEDKIIKSSPNIIDLIEVGDYVNGDRVKALKGDIESHKINNEEDVIYTEYINDYDEWCGYEEDEIKSIVTREQFESIEYKIGGDK